MEWLQVIGGVAVWFVLYHVLNCWWRMSLYIPLPAEELEAKIWLFLYCILSIGSWAGGAYVAYAIWADSLMWLFNAILIIYGAWTLLFYAYCATKRLAFIKSRTQQEKLIHAMHLLQKIENGRIDEVNDSELNGLFGEQIAQIVRETEEKKKQRKEELERRFDLFVVGGDDVDDITKEEWESVFGLYTAKLMMRVIDNEREYRKTLPPEDEEWKKEVDCSGECLTSFRFKKSRRGEQIRSYIFGEANNMRFAVLGKVEAFKSGEVDFSEDELLMLRELYPPQKYNEVIRARRAAKKNKA